MKIPWLLTMFEKEYNMKNPMFQKALQEIFEIEGGWSDDPDDSGGKTKYGIWTVFRTCPYGECGGLECGPVYCSR